MSKAVYSHRAPLRYDVPKELLECSWRDVRYQLIHYREFFEALEVEGHPHRAVMEEIRTNHYKYINKAPDETDLVHGYKGYNLFRHYTYLNSRGHHYAFDDITRVDLQGFLFRLIARAYRCGDWDNKPIYYLAQYLRKKFGLKRDWHSVSNTLMIIAGYMDGCNLLRMKDLICDERDRINNYLASKGEIIRMQTEEHKFQLFVKAHPAAIWEGLRELLGDDYDYALHHHLAMFTYGQTVVPVDTDGKIRNAKYEGAMSGTEYTEFISDVEAMMRRRKLQALIAD